MIYIDHLLSLARNAAMQAGEVILEIYHSGDFGIEMKSDQSPLTLADRAAHTVIKNALQQTDLPMLSEEGRSITYDERKEWDYFWLIDPLDGTKEFIKRTGEFTVNIALMKKNIPLGGVIYAPDIDVMYYGSGDTNVFKVNKGEEIQLPATTKKKTLQELREKNGITVVASKSHNNEETTAFISQFQNAKLSSMGSSLKLMLLAEGSADIYPRLAPTMEWDTAAGDAILRSLKMCVYKIDLATPLEYNKPDLLNPPFIAL